jgi:hypothetical protein
VLHFHRKPHRGVYGTHTLALKSCHDLAGDFIDVLAGVVEFQVGDRPGRAADWLPIHPADEAQERLGGRKEAQDILALIVKGGSVDLDQSSVVRPAIEAELTQPAGIQDSRYTRPILGAFLEMPHGWVFSEFHDRLI